MLRFFKKHDINDFTVYNRTIENAEKLVQEVGGKARLLSDLEKRLDFDVIITCTGSENKIITPEIYDNIINDNKTKTVIDLAIPYDFDLTISEKHPINYISIGALKEISDLNIKERQEEVIHAEAIIKVALEDFHQHFTQES